MAHVKVVPGDSWDFGTERLQLVKVARDGLRGNDLRNFIKRASHSFADAIRHMDLKPGDVPVHCIALGATEFYGPNRNGDGFKEATCRDYHHTFVKHARWYRNHANKDPQKSYGFVKHSEFNDPMKRVELLCILNGTKEAADRNGGMVADQELKMLESGKDIPTSMACKVAYDICAGCDNKARNRTEYCTGEDEGGMCKRGGCKNRLTFVHSDGFMNHVDNPHPHWFDESLVFRGADRIAGTNGIVKAASGLILGGAALAEHLGVELPAHMAGEQTLWPTRLEKLAIKLAQLENEIGTQGTLGYDWSFAVQEPVSWDDHHSHKPQVLAALMLNKIAMPIEGYAEIMMDKAAHDNAAMAKRLLPGVYGRMVSDGSIHEANLKPYLPCGQVPTQLLKWASSRANDYSFDARLVEKRAQRAALYGASPPAARQPSMLKVAGAAEAVARGYALYKLAFLQALAGHDADFDLTTRLVVRQNYL